MNLKEKRWQKPGVRYISLDQYALWARQHVTTSKSHFQNVLLGNSIMSLKLTLPSLSYCVTASMALACRIITTPNSGNLGFTQSLTWEERRVFL